MIVHHNNKYDLCNDDSLKNYLTLMIVDSGVFEETLKTPEFLIGENFYSNSLTIASKR